MVETMSVEVMRTNNDMVLSAYGASAPSENTDTLDMSSMSIDNILQYVVLTLMDTRDNAANSIQGLMASVQANNKKASDIQNQASAVQGAIPSKDTDRVKYSQVKDVITYCMDNNVKLNGQDALTWFQKSAGEDGKLSKASMVELNGYLNQSASDANQVGQNQQTMLSQNVQNLGNIQKNISSVLSKLIDIQKDIIGIIR